jgi:hypothetical protein
MALPGEEWADYVDMVLPREDHGFQHLPDLNQEWERRKGQEQQEQERMQQSA